jgi:hypothetical protein
MHKITFAEERKIALEFTDGRRFEFKREQISHPEAEHLYALNYADDQRSEHREFNRLPSVEEIQTFLREVQMELTESDAFALRLRLTV